jgi:hypothetical protein
MRMDIEISPGARVQRRSAPARDNMSRTARELAGCDGRMTEKRVCLLDHPAPVRRECRFIEKLTKGVLWRHSSFNLVEPRPFAPSAA